MNLLTTNDSCLSCIYFVSLLCLPVLSALVQICFGFRRFINVFDWLIDWLIDWTNKCFFFTACRVIKKMAHVCMWKWAILINNWLTLVLRRGCKQFSLRCSKTRSKGVKVLLLPLSSSFPLIIAKKKNKWTYHLPRGRVTCQNWEVRWGDFKAGR